jgi:hypothetical protein
MVLPHRRLGLQTAEFRAANHSRFLGGPHAAWDADAAFGAASLVHFADWPLPMPWVLWPPRLRAEMTPVCAGNEAARGGGRPCRERELWLGLYDDFRQRRKVRRLPGCCFDWLGRGRFR